MATAGKTHAEITSALVALRPSWTELESRHETPEGAVTWKIVSMPALFRAGLFWCAGREAGKKLLRTREFGAGALQAFRRLGGKLALVH